MTEREAGRAALVFVESNPDGTRRRFVRIAREMGERAGAGDGAGGDVRASP